MGKERIELEGMPNTRDLGGYRTRDGRAVKNKRILRSGALGHGTKQDWGKLCGEFGMKKIVDFRTGVEKEQLPDPELPGVEYLHNPIFMEEAMGISREKKPADTDMVAMMLRICEEIGGDNDKFLSDLYLQMVMTEYSVGQIKRFFSCLAEQTDGSILYHCSEGKDRVGVVTALFLLLMGVHEDTVMEDYLLTNFFVRDKRERILSMAAQKGCGEAVLRQIDSMNSVKESYLGSVIREIERSYGDVEHLFRAGLGFSSEWIGGLRDNYLG